jgi:hypothetical protein
VCGTRVGSGYCNPGVMRAATEGAMQEVESDCGNILSKIYKPL